MYSVSVTERGTFKRCKRKWFYANKLKLNRIVPEIHYILGSMMHQAHAAWLLSPDDNFEKIFLSEASKYIGEIETNHKKLQETRLLPDLDVTPMYDQVVLGQVMARNYQLKWKLPLPPKMRLLMPEQEISINITENFYLKGRLDALILDSHNQIYVLEHKTWGQHPNAAELAENDQFLAYIYIATKLNLGEVAGIAYDGLWKRDKIPKGRTLDDLFDRRILRRNQYELAEFEKMVPYEILEMERFTKTLIEDNLNMYTEPPVWFFTTVPYDGCGDCTFRTLCRTHSTNQDSEFQLNSFYFQRES